MKLSDLAFVLVISFSSEIPVRVKPHFDNVLTLDIRLVCKEQNNKTKWEQTFIGTENKQVIARGERCGGGQNR